MLKAVHKVGENANEQGFGLVGILASVVIVLAIAGGGFYVWHKDHKTKSNAVATSQNKGSSQTKSSSSKSTTTNPYAGWKTYTSSYNQLSFKYPTTGWTTSGPTYQGEVSTADSLDLKSSTGELSVVWTSAVEGEGGACSTSEMPGSSDTSGDGPCPYFYVTDKQKLANADLYFVDGVEETSSGTSYQPWCALQGPGGLLQSESNTGYLVFSGSKEVTISGTDEGQDQSSLVCSTSDNAGHTPFSGTKAQATAFLSSTEMQQAKLILLSASY